MPLSRPARLRLTAALAGAVVVAGATSAAAHVTVSPEVAPAGSYAILTFSIPHGCEGSPTTEIAIEIPQEIVAVTPTVHPNWEAEKLAADGSPAGHGPVDRVVYSARDPLPADLRDAFELSVRLPDEAGDALAFPVIQTCADGEEAWAEVADEGQDPHELEAPAPLVTVTDPDDGPAETSAMGIAGVGLGATGAVLGGAALFIVLRRERVRS